MKMAVFFLTRVALNLSHTNALFVKNQLVNVAVGMVMG
jgi:hypothetical protein